MERALTPYEGKVIAYFRGRFGLGDDSEEHIRSLFTYETRTEWQLDRFGWRIFFTVSFICISVSLMAVLIADVLGISLPEQAVNATGALIWAFYIGGHACFVCGTWWRYLRKRPVSLDRDAILFAYECDLKPFEDRLYQILMTCIVLVLAGTGRYGTAFILVILVVVFRSAIRRATDRIHASILQA